MKYFVAAMGLIACPSPLLAQNTVQVRPTIRSDGVYVPGHVRTAPNSTAVDNWSSRPNTNPYTGKVGTKDPYSLPAYKPYKPYKPK